MPEAVQITANGFMVKVPFGGGIHSRASAEDIHEKECEIGQNFQLDPQDRQFRNRKPFDLIGTVPNAAEVRGLVNLLKSDGTSSVLVQAGDTVYEWDGISTFTSKGTVTSTAKLRGRLEHNWQLTDKVIITDLNLVQPVMEWDGITLQNVTFTSEDGSTAFGTFRARYCSVSNERAIFSNIHDNGTNFPHLIVGAKRGDYTVITVANRPSSALSEEDPFFLVQPDMRYINGMVLSFQTLNTSSLQGSLFRLTGASAKDFSFTELFPRSGASGDESMTFVGNDVAYGRNGRIESLAATDKFADVESDDLSQDIFDQIQTFGDWTIVYNSRNQRIYCIPDSQSQAWVFHKPMAKTGLSPWSKWITAHASSFQPTAIMNMIDPADGLEYVYFGDSSGNFYRMEGSGTGGDSGTTNVTTIRKSALFKAPIDLEAYNIEGWVEYKAGDAFTLTLDFLFRGQRIFNRTLTISIPAVSNRKVYGGGNYYSDGNGYGSFSGILTRQKIGVPGKDNALQVQATVEGTGDFSISEIGLTFTAA